MSVCRELWVRSSEARSQQPLAGPRFLGTEFTMLWTRDYEDYFYKNGDIFDIIDGGDEDETTPSTSTDEEDADNDEQMHEDGEGSGVEATDDLFADDDDDDEDEEGDEAAGSQVPREIDASKLSKFFRSPLYKHWKGFVRMAPDGYVHMHKRAVRES